MPIKSTIMKRRQPESEKISEKKEKILRHKNIPINLRKRKFPFKKMSKRFEQDI